MFKISQGLAYMAAIRILLFVLAPPILVAPMLMAQEAWTLQQCIAAALQDNPQSKISGLNISRQEAEVLKAKRAYQPVVYGTGAHSIFLNPSYRPGNGTGPGFGTMGIRAELDIFTGLQRMRISAAEAKALDLAHSEFQALQLNLSAQVAEAYIEALYSKELEKITASQIELSEALVLRAGANIEAGAASAAEAARLLAQLETERAELLARKAATSNYIAALAMLAGRSPQEAYSGTIMLDAKLPGRAMAELLQLEKATELAMASAPVKTAELQAVYAQSQVELAKHKFLPKLSAFAFCGMQYDSYINYRTNPGEMATVGFSLTVPIYNKTHSRIELAQARTSKQMADYAADNIKQEARLKITRAYTDALYAQQKMLADEKALEHYRTSMEATEAQLQGGLISAADYTREKTGFAAAQAQLARSKYMMLYHIISLELFATGTIGQF
jgi:outer membrane protein